MWRHIDKVCDEALKRYPTTLEEDIELLRRDQENAGALSYNKRNCILYRKSEKEVLYFFKDCASKVEKLAKMTEKEARAEVGRWNISDSLGQMD